MIDYWTDTLTVYHSDEARNWTKTAYKNCFYGNKTRQAFNGSNIVQDTSTIVRIPLPATLSKGDIVAFGELVENIPQGSGNDFLSTHKAFKINSTSINDKVEIKHIRGES